MTESGIGPSVVHTSDLPSYPRSNSQDQQGPQTTYEYRLEQKGKTWLKLAVKNNHSTNIQSLPVFIDNDTISGSVEVQLPKQDGIKSLSVILVGGSTAVGQEEVRFLEVEHQLWPVSGGGRPLLGDHSWPFSIVIPAEVPLAAKYNGEPGKMYGLPPTFSERANPMYIDYKLIVRVKRGILRTNPTLTQTIAFLPRRIGQAPSAYKQKAYAAGLPLPDIDIDPEGWKELSPISFQGTLFGSKEVEIHCKIALSSPLTYALGSPIHFLVTLSSNDDQALDLVCGHGSLRIFLVRSVVIGPGTTGSSTARSDTVFRSSAGRAIVWRLDTPTAGSYRRLQGEIDVKRSTKPSFDFPTVSIQYHLVVLPCRIAGFVPSTPEDQSLLSQPVSIVTAYPPGTTLPRSCAPPGYEIPIEGDYNNVMGYLENGGNGINLWG